MWGDRIPKKTLSYELIESLSALGLNHKTMAQAIGWSESAFCTHLGKDKQMQEAIDKGRSRAIIDIGYSLMNKACGPALWEKDEEKKKRELGKGASDKVLIYVDQKLSGPQTHKIEVTGDPGLCKSFTELVARCEEREKEKEVKEQEKGQKQHP